VNSLGAKLSFSGVCNSKSVGFTDVDVTQYTDVNGFPNKTDKQIADSIENWFTDLAVFLDPFNIGGCYNHTSIGTYVTAVNKSTMKTATVWVGEVTLQGVRP